MTLGGSHVARDIAPEQRHHRSRTPSLRARSRTPADTHRSGRTSGTSPRSRQAASTMRHAAWVAASSGIVGDDVEIASRPHLTGGARPIARKTAAMDARVGAQGSIQGFDGHPHGLKPPLLPLCQGDDARHGLSSSHERGRSRGGLFSRDRHGRHRRARPHRLDIEQRLRPHEFAPEQDQGRHERRADEQADQTPDLNAAEHPHQHP